MTIIIASNASVGACSRNETKPDASSSLLRAALATMATERAKVGAIAEAAARVAAEASHMVAPRGLWVVATRMVVRSVGSSTPSVGALSATATSNMNATRVSPVGVRVATVATAQATTDSRGWTGPPVRSATMASRRMLFTLTACILLLSC